MIPQSGKSHQAKSQHPRSPTQMGTLALILIAASVILGVYAIHAQLPPNAVSLPQEQVLARPIRILVPEGWAFFTRSPRIADPVPYLRATDGSWRKALLAPHSEPRNAFGFARLSRAQGVEIGLLTGGPREEDWRDCTGAVQACLAADPAVPAANRARVPTLCGDVGLVRQPPVPWAWSRSARTVTMPSQVARLEVSC